MSVVIRRALLSVSDKTGIVELARELSRHGIEILSTGGTAKLLESQGIAVKELSQHTGFPEIMGGRVKSLHPRIHGGLLGRRGVDEEVMVLHDIPPIHLLVVNLYPFAESVAQPDCSYIEAIENIDIGGPAMVRAASKNHDMVTVLVDPSDYPIILTELETNDGGTSKVLRARLAAKAFAHTARYDTMIANYLQTHQADSTDRFPKLLPLFFEKKQNLRYGENSHQEAAFYRDPNSHRPCVANARILQGKELSFNNIADADTAIECVRQFNMPSCVIVKHANPCGVASARTTLSAYELAWRTDPTSAYGGIIALNRPIDAATASTIISRQFVEVIAAPSFDEAARAVLSSKPNIRLLEITNLNDETSCDLEFRSVSGGLLVQSRDFGMVQLADLKIVSSRIPGDAELADLMFAWQVCKYVKSNAIVYARALATLGVGAGQMSRVYSSRVAAMKAADEKLEVRGAAMASDAFLPFRDSLDVAAQYGIAAVIQPGGSMRDSEVIAAADQHGIAMVFTGMRHFRH